MTSQKFSSAAFVVRNRQFLFGKRSESSDWYESVWDIFGGHSEHDEDPPDTLKRELQEELGIIPTLYNLYDSIEIADKVSGETMLLHIYFITDWMGGEPKNCSNEHSEIGWFAFEQLFALPLASDEYINIIRLWLNMNVSL